ncbi:MAG: hypothetical protein P8Y67_06905 [Alphaproteobacteria bacterium]
MYDLIVAFGETFGILPLYAVIIVYGGFNSSNFRQLYMFLGIACGLYITMFQVFNLKAKFGIFDMTSYLPIPQNIGNAIVGALFVCVLGISAYAVRHLVFPPKES